MKPAIAVRVGSSAMTDDSTPRTSITPRKSLDFEKLAALPRPPVQRPFLLSIGEVRHGWTGGAKSPNTGK